MKSAIVVGATGLVGRELVERLESDPEVERLVLLVRRAPDRAVAKKTEVRITDFRAPASWTADGKSLEAEVLFSALGTTLKVAGSKAAQYEVDYTFQYEVAKAAKAAGVSTIALCSSLGASADSAMFYARMKGELDRDVRALGFERTRIVRPSALVGDRKEARPGESIAIAAGNLLGKLPLLSKYRPIPARTVAAAMIALAKDPTPGSRTVDSSELFALAGP